MQKNAYTPKQPAFSESMDLLETTDPGHADLFNEVFKQIFDNTVVVKNQLDARADTHICDTLASAIATLNGAEIGGYKIADNVLIVQADVPDLWITTVTDTKTEYAYTTDESVIDALMADGEIQCGYYKVARLEIGKIDLSSIQSDIDAIKTQLSGVETALEAI